MDFRAFRQLATSFCGVTAIGSLMATSFVTPANSAAIIRTFGRGVQEANEDFIRHAGMIVGAGIVERDRQHTVFITDGGNRP